MRVTAAALLHCAVHLAFASTALVFANEPADLPPVFANVKEGLKPLQSAGSTVTPSPTPTPTPLPVCDCDECKEFVQEGTKQGEKEDSGQVEVCAAYLQTRSCSLLGEEEAVCRLTLRKDYTRSNACISIGYCEKPCQCTCQECKDVMDKATKDGGVSACVDYINAKPKCTIETKAKQLCKDVVQKGKSVEEACTREGVCEAE